MTTRQALLCIALIGASEIATMALYFGCRLLFHADPFGLYANIFISVGGLAFGFFGPLGAIPAARLAGVAPSPTLLGLMVGFTLTAVIAYKGLPYFLSDGSVSAGGVLAYFDAVMAHSRIGLNGHSESAEIGRYGYLLEALDFVWAGIAAAVLHRTLRRIPHCHACGVYFRKIGANSLRFAGTDEADRYLAGLPQAAPHRAEMLMHMRHRDDVKARRGAVQLEVTRRECPSCHEQSLIEQLSVHNGKNFIPCPGGSTTGLLRPRVARRSRPPRLSTHPLSRRSSAERDSSSTPFAVERGRTTNAAVR